MGHKKCIVNKKGRESKKLKTIDIGYCMKRVKNGRLVI